MAYQTIVEDGIDFSLTNPIVRASATMGECAALQAGLRRAAE